MRSSRKFWCWLVGWVLVAVLLIVGRVVAPALWDVTVKWPVLVLAALGTLGVASMIADWGRSSAGERASAAPNT